MFLQIGYEILILLDRFEMLLSEGWTFYLFMLPVYLL
jgi:hypothetical protein